MVWPSYNCYGPITKSCRSRDKSSLLIPHGPPAQAPILQDQRSQSIHLHSDLLSRVEDNKGRVMASSGNCTEQKNMSMGECCKQDHPPLHMSLQENCQEWLTTLDILPTDPPDSSNTCQYSPHSPLVSTLLLPQDFQVCIFYNLKNM